MYLGDGDYNEVFLCWFLGIDSSSIDAGEPPEENDPLYDVFPAKL